MGTGTRPNYLGGSSSIFPCMLFRPWRVLSAWVLCLRATGRVPADSKTGGSAWERSGVQPEPASFVLPVPSSSASQVTPAGSGPVNSECDLLLPLRLYEGINPDGCHPVDLYTGHLDQPERARIDNEASSYAVGQAPSRWPPAPEAAAPITQGRVGLVRNELHGVQVEQRSFFRLSLLAQESQPMALSHRCPGGSMGGPLGHAWADVYSRGTELGFPLLPAVSTT